MSSDYMETAESSPQTQNSQGESKFISLVSLLGALGLIVGSLLPWFNDDGDSGTTVLPDDFTGVGIAGWGFGAVTLLMGLLVLAGFNKSPFGISQKIWSGSLGLTALLSILAFSFDETYGDIIRTDKGPDLEPGIWIALIGAAILTNVLLMHIFADNSSGSSSGKDSGPWQQKQLSDSGIFSIGGISVVMTVSAIMLPYTFPAIQSILSLDAGIEADSLSQSLLNNELRGTGSITLSILGVLIILCYGSMLTKRPVSASKILILVLPLIFINSTFIFRALSYSSGSFFGGVSNLVLLLGSIIIFVIAFREVQTETKSEEI